MNTVYFILQSTMYFMIPLLVVALGALYSERSGVSNIGMEGIMIVGAFTGVLVLRESPEWISGQMLYLLAILAAALAGMLYSCLHAWSSIRLRAEQTISGTALNLFAPAFCIFAARSLYGVKQIHFSDSFFISKVPVLGDIPFIGPCFFTNCYLSTYLGLILLIVLAFLLKRTRFGLRLSSCGENPDAAASAGISVTRMRYTGVLLSGLLGGAGGILFVVPTSTEFNADVAGYGFLALSVLILGQWKPLGILLSSFFFGLMKAVSSTWSGIPGLAELGIPSEVYKILPYLATLVVLAFSSSRSVAPRATGIPYDDGLGFGGNKAVRRTVLSLLVAALVVLTVSVTKTTVKNNRDKGVSAGYGAQTAIVISSTASIDDKSFIQSEWEGVTAFSASRNKTVKYYQSTDNSDQNLLNAVHLAVRGNANCVILSDENFCYIAAEAAALYPDIHFILTDGTPTNENGEVTIPDNLDCLFVGETESGFLAGYAAVIDGYRKLGFLGGAAIPAVTRFGEGFLAGAQQAAEELQLDEGEVTVKYQYTGSFSATPEAMSLASVWYQTGTEVIFACGGAMGNSVMKAAENCGKAVIGVDADQSGESPSVITSAMKNVGNGLKSALEKLDNGEKLSSDGICRLTSRDGAVCLPMENSHFSAFTEEMYADLLSRIESGKINIPWEYGFDHRFESLDRLKVTMIQ